MTKEEIEKAEKAELRRKARNKRKANLRASLENANNKRERRNARLRWGR